LTLDHSNSVGKSGLDLFLILIDKNAADLLEDFCI